MNSEMKDRLEILASRTCWCDNRHFDIFERSDGNLDYAYNGGWSDGCVMLARELLKLYNTTDATHECKEV